ncbi:uncharacterized protein LOC124110792 [Haliotis rufescens]|uniref:uncharacterized protein LOC124110792 n=1 Tax=Haliotis rufescens TaxID=6454 RepID=UPI00201F0704|nr:uncharacterized protein LOC124110792 [Haliotis rufescens]
MPPMTEDTYGSRVEKWTMREMQLNRLHEEIIARRESLLHSTGAFLRQQVDKKGTVPPITHTLDEITVRNERLIKDLRDTEWRLAQEAEKPADTKFLTLQSNYWSMIRSMEPLWKESMAQAGLRQPAAGSTTPKTART